MGKKNKKKARGWRSAWRKSTFTGGRGSRWTLWVAPVLIVGLVGLALVILLHPDTPSTPAASVTHRPTASPSPSASPAVAVAVAVAVACPPSDPNWDAITPPEDLDWVSVNGDRWPTSVSAGPKVRRDDIGYCFDRSPVGAALAAESITNTIRSGTKATAARVLATQFVQNKGVAVQQKTVSARTDGQPMNAQALGYQVGGFDGNTAQVLLVEKWTDTGQTVGWVFTVVWTGGDWQIQLSDDGQGTIAGAYTVTPDQYTPWQVTP